MSMFTPARWKIDLSKRNSLGRAQKVIFAESPTYENFQIEIAYVFGGNTKSVEEAEANARLIASAPELLEALKDIFDNISKCPCEVDDNDILLWENARKAIAKAEAL